MSAFVHFLNKPHRNEKPYGRHLERPWQICSMTRLLPAGKMASSIQVLFAQRRRQQERVAAAAAAPKAGRAAGWLAACLSSLIDGWHHSTMTSTLAYSQQSLHSVAPAHSVAMATMDIMTDINPARWHLIVSPEQADSIYVFSRLLCIFPIACPFILLCRSAFTPQYH